MCGGGGSESVIVTEVCAEGGSESVIVTEVCVDLGFIRLQIRRIFWIRGLTVDPWYRNAL